MSKVYSYFDRPKSPSLVCNDASLTRQEFVSDADLNNIMARYAAGLAPIGGGTRTPLFGDFSDVPDYQTALQHVIDAQERFDQLPSPLRKRFDNDPAKLIAFLESKDNKDEAVKLGLIAPPVSVPVKGDGDKDVAPPETT